MRKKELIDANDFLEKQLYMLNRAENYMNGFHSIGNLVENEFKVEIYRRHILITKDNITCEDYYDSKGVRLCVEKLKQKWDYERERILATLIQREALEEQSKEQRKEGE